MQLPVPFLSRMQAQLGESYPKYLTAMDEPPRRGVRVNTLKLSPEAFLALSRLPLIKSDIAPEGFVLTGDAPALGADPLHQAGLFYIQEPSAMSAVALLSPKPGMRVLDLCAAPGGKATQIAARMQGQGLLVANEFVPNRAQVLARNMERMGARNAICCSMRPDALSALLPEYFDAVLVDAPCSGEGMFRKEPQAVLDWSPEHVTACAQRQKKILSEAVRMLSPGGRLVYSTCTFSEEENENVIADLLATEPSLTLAEMRRYWPHNSMGEGHFAALLVKEGLPISVRNATVPRVKEKELAPYGAFVRQYMQTVPENTPYLLPDGRCILLPETLPACWQKLRILSAGVLAGELKGGRFLPGHALFLAYPKEAFCQAVELTQSTLPLYLEGNTVPVPAELSGWCAVCVSGYPIGFGKAVSGTLKNHLPKGLRQSGSIRYTDVYGTD
ncbi:MAG: RsmB/NOP family class I SAM-dependent RNA methyltransferase [Eubacteriales bacterium]|nr:RsmB/NOP family class I SAM-dependent RNA methyltransferase [Eubacteriales bacterium]